MSTSTSLGLKSVLVSRRGRMATFFGLGGALFAIGAGAIILLTRETPSTVNVAPAIVVDVTAARLKERMQTDRNLLVAFVGSRTYFEERHIPTSVCVPYDELDTYFASVDPRRDIVLYCGCCAGISEGISGNAARRLMEKGFRNVAHLRGHFAAWQAAQYACEGTRPDAPVERAFANARQKEELDQFAVETRRRRGELSAALGSEKNPARRAEMEKRLAEADKESELQGLALKRKISVENGDVEKVKSIDKLVESKRGQ